MVKVTKEQRNKLVLAGYTGSFVPKPDGIYALGLKTKSQLEEELNKHQLGVQHYSALVAKTRKRIDEYVDPVEDALKELKS